MDKPLLHDAGQVAAGGGGGVQIHGDAPVRVRLQLRHGGKRNGLRRLAAAALQFRLIIGSSLSGIGEQAKRYERHRHYPQQAHKEGRLAVVQGGLNAVFHTDLTKSHGAGGVVHLIGAAPQQGRGVGFPLAQLHKLHHPLVAGNLNVLAQHQVGNPHQGIEPVQRQGDKGDHLDPVVALLQVSALMGEDLLAGGLAHTAGNVDFRLDKAQHKGRLNFIRFIAAGHRHRVLDLLLQAQIGTQADQHNDGGSACPQDPDKLGGNGRQRYIAGLQAEGALHGNGHQQPDPGQHPQEADVLSGRPF